MVIGASRIELYLSGNNSLKEKRRVIKSIKDRIRSNFNVSVAETEDLDKWQKAVIGLACVSNDRVYANQVISSVINMIQGIGGIEIIDYSIEIL